MSIAKNIEVSSTSTVSFEDAIKKGIAEVTGSLRNVKGAWIKEQKVDIDNGQISRFVVMMVVTFVIENGDKVDA